MSNDYEITMTVKLKRNGLLKWLENLGIINEKSEMIAIQGKQPYILGSTEKIPFEYNNIKRNKL